MKSELHIITAWKYSGSITIPGLNQRNRISRRHILRNFLRGIGLHSCRGWLGDKSEICRAGCQERQAGTLRHELKLQSTGRISSEYLSSALKALPLIESGLPRLSRIIFI